MCTQHDNCTTIWFIFQIGHQSLEIVSNSMKRYKIIDWLSWLSITLHAEYHNEA